MPSERYVPVTEDDLGLTPEQVRDLVEGAQKYLPPDDEDEEEDDDEEDDGEPIPTEPNARP